ncbi:hypothetical protein TNCV_3878771 [Trichonephila clavipes]|nr:hypothetical protein TNCV_3878771 [Trichonephila clavipes]
MDGGQKLRWGKLQRHLALRVRGQRWFRSMGVFSGHSLGSVVRVPTSFNTFRYVELMGYHLHSFMLFCYPHGKGDSSKTYVPLTSTGCLMAGWMSIPDFSVINCPPRSPD